MTTLCLALSLTVGIELHLGFEHDDQFGPGSFQHERLAVQGILGDPSTIMAADHMHMPSWGGICLLKFVI
jgi:hypothetical protein